MVAVARTAVCMVRPCRRSRRCCDRFGRPLFAVWVLSRLLTAMPGPAVVLLGGRENRESVCDRDTKQVWVGGGVG